MPRQTQSDGVPVPAEVAAELVGAGAPLPHRMPANPVQQAGPPADQGVLDVLPQKAWANDVTTMGRVLDALKRLL